MPFLNSDGSWACGDDGDFTFTKSVRDEALWEGAGSVSGGVTMSARVGSVKNLTEAECYFRNVTVRACVNAIVRHPVQCKVRFFTDAGEEVGAGEPLDWVRNPAPRTTWRPFLGSLLEWFLVHGEMAGKIVPDPETGRLRHVLPLCPRQLEVDKPSQPSDVWDVSLWRYYWLGRGTPDYIPATRLFYDGMGNPMPGGIRPASPLFTGAVEVTAQHNAALYTKKFFDNSSIPDGMLILPEGVGRQQREEIERKFTRDFGTWFGNSHKTFVVSGSKDVKWEPIETSFQGDSFLGLQERIDRQIRKLYGVPDVEIGGVEDDTRFKMAPETRKSFFENVIAPLCRRVTEAMQYQIVDPYMRGAKFTRIRPRRRDGREGKPSEKWFPTKSLEAAFEAAKAERTDSGLLILLDTDTLSIMRDVTLARSEMATKYREAVATSPRRAAEYFDIDVDDDRPERDEIFVDQKNIPVTNLKLAEGMVPGLKPKPVEGGGGGDKPKPAAKKSDSSEYIYSEEQAGGGADGIKQPDTHAAPAAPVNKQLSDAQKQQLDHARKLVRQLRRMSLKSVDDEQLWGLSDADALAGEGLTPELKEEIRRIRFAVRRAIKGGDREQQKAAIRSLFNSLDDNSHLKKALGL